MNWWGHLNIITSEINHCRYPLPADCSSHLAAKCLISTHTAEVYKSKTVLR